MKKTLFSSGVGRALMLPAGCAALVVFATNHSAPAQATTDQAVVVTAAGQMTKK